MPGYWRAPRELARMLAERELTPNGYALLHFLAESRADRPQGFHTTIGLLADVLGVHERTIRRNLVALRDLGLIAYADHAGRAAFVIRTTSALAALVSEPVSEPMSEVGEKRPGRVRGLATRKPASERAKQEGRAEPVSEVAKGPETETETEKGGRSVGTGEDPADHPPLAELFERARVKSLDDGIAGR